MKLFNKSQSPIAAAIIELLTGAEKPKSEFASRTFGTHPKRCKSCALFKGCQFANNRNPMDVACKDYEKRKKK